MNNSRECTSTMKNEYEMNMYMDGTSRNIIYI